MRGSVCCRKRDGDDEISCHKAEQDEYEELALPPRQELRKHRNRALTVRAFLRDPTVNWQRAQQRQQHEDYRRDWRESAGGEEGNPWLVTKRRKVINAGQ